MYEDVEYYFPCLIYWEPIVTTRHGHSRGGAVSGLYIMIQFRTGVFPTTRRLARIQAMLAHFLHRCLACGGDVHEFVKHSMRECPRWECHRRHFGTLALKFNGFLRPLFTSPSYISALLLGGAPFLHSPFILQEMGELFSC
jgi:hypothetical protein